MKKIMLVTGTRPQIIKSVPIILEMLKRDDIELKFVHTGQHYDDKLFKDFILEFELPVPTNLRVSGNAPNMIANIISKLSFEINKFKPDLVLVPGDTNSALAAGLTAAKMDIPFGHIEAGIREYSMNMHEEMNRRMLDHSASILFAPSPTGYKHLRDEQVQGKVYLVGDTNYDLYKMRKPTERELEAFRIIHNLPAFRIIHNLPASEYIVFTMHRREILANKDWMINVLNAASDIGKIIIWPMHPNAKKVLKRYGINLWQGIMRLESLGYDDMMKLIKHAKLVITDSGGLQKEAYFSETPCVTLRNITAWEETVKEGANMLVPPYADVQELYRTFKIQYGKKLKNLPVFYGNGQAAYKITEICLNEDIKIPTRRNER